MDHAGLVQPIMLPPNAKRFPLSNVVTAVATASAAALVAADRDDPAWLGWLSGRFTKSVRVAKSRADFAIALAAGDYTVESGGLCAVAFAPTTYRQMPKWMGRARVEGLNCHDDVPTAPSDGEWSLGLVAQMSSGKAAAQAAHATCMIVLRTGALPRFSVFRADDSVTGVVEVVDAGLTEFGGIPTRTVVASPR